MLNTNIGGMMHIVNATKRTQMITLFSIFIAITFTINTKSNLETGIFIVKIPEIKAPQVNIKVFVDGSEVAARIHKEFKAV